MQAHDIDSLASFRATVCAVLADAVAQRARRLVFADPRFEGWPLEDPALVGALTAFVRLPARRVVLLGESFAGVAVACPRFVAWRKVWSHCIEALKPGDETLALPTALLVDRRLALRVADRVHWRGRLMADEPAVHRVADELDAFAQRSEPTFGPDTLGL